MKKNKKSNKYSIAFTVCLLAFAIGLGWAGINQGRQKVESHRAIGEQLNSIGTTVTDLADCDLPETQQHLCKMSKKELMNVISGSSRYMLVQYFGANYNITSKDQYKDEFSRVSCTHFKDYKTFFCNPNNEQSMRAYLCTADIEDYNPEC